MSQAEMPSSPIEASAYQYIVGIDIGSQTCSGCVLKPDKSQAIRPIEFPNAMPGFTLLQERLEALGVQPNHILIGLEATSRDARKSLSLSGKSRVFPLSAPSAQTHQFAQQRGLRAKTDRLDASTIARMLLSG